MNQGQKNKDAEMATLFKQLQNLNPGLSALEAADKERHNCNKTSTALHGNEKVWIEPTIEMMHDPLFSCTCFDDPDKDYRSFVRKPEHLLNLGPMRLRNPLHITCEQDKADMDKKIKRATKNARAAHKTALKAKRAVERSRAKFIRLQSDAITARSEIRDARQATRLASREVNLAHEAQERTMEWSACVEREGKEMIASANKAKARANDPILRGQNCNHQFRNWGFRVVGYCGGPGFRPYVEAVAYWSKT